MRSTKDLNTALERVVEILPSGRLKSTGRGRRELAFVRGGPKRRDKRQTCIEGTIARCLYVAVFCATTDLQQGGLGMDLEEVADAVRLRSEGVSDHGVTPHEYNMLMALARAWEES